MNWIYWVLIFLGMLVLFTALGVIWKRRKFGGGTNEKLCSHKFKYEGHFICQDKPRAIQVCRKCGVAIHIPIYTIKRLREIEE